MSRPQRTSPALSAGPVDPSSLPLIDIEALDHEARGIGHAEGKVIFVDGALTGERVRVRIYKQRPSYDQGELVRLERAGASRVTPACAHFGVCGGCNMQHADPSAQIAYKQRILEDNLQRIGRVRAGVMLPTIQGPSWGYRHRARLSVRLVVKKGGVLVGFHERNSSFVAEMRSCRILPPHVSGLIEPLKELVGALSLADRMPQVEVAVGDAATVLVFRILQALTPDDEARLRQFGDHHQVQIWLQTKGPETVHRFHPAVAPALSYTLPEFGLDMPFGPSEFTQVNPAVNRVLVRRAMQLLAPQPGQRVADLFCGLGNFSLPIAVLGADVVGVEGSAALVRRATENAAHNGLSQRARFEVADLFQATPESLAALGPFDSMLIDPPRDGAVEVVKSLSAHAPRRIVYVSCNPATLARDAQILVHQHGYALEAAGVVNMFPHTAHVESIALFTR